MATKVLLMFPNTANEGVAPLAVASLGQIAKQKGCEVKYFESSFYEMFESSHHVRKQTGEFKAYSGDAFNLLPRQNLQRDFEALMEDFQPDILAVTANSLEWELFLELMQASPPFNQKPFVIVGGCHATVDPEGTIANQYIDAICVGEGEKAWSQFLTNFEQGKDISKIGNLWVKTSSGINKNPLSNLMTAEELWSMQLDFSFFDERHFQYVFDGSLYLKGNLELSRGCPYDCTYCVNTGFKEIYKGLGKFMRVRPYDNMRLAVQDLSKYKIDMIAFQDESFFSVPIKSIEQFCEWYGSEVKLPCMVQVRAESVTEKKVALMANMGVPIQMSVGIESGSDRVLSEICNRQTKVEDLKHSFQIMKDANVRTTGYTMIGFPTETRKEAFQTIEMVRSVDLDVSVMSIFFPFKGTPLRDLCIEEGYITGDEPARTFVEGPILRNQPMSPEEIVGIRHCYALYTKLPKEYFPDIERCERDYENNVELYQKLVNLVNESYYKTWDVSRNSASADRT